MARSTKRLLLILGFALIVLAWLSRYDAQPEGAPRQNIEHSRQEQAYRVRDRWTGKVYICSPSTWCKLVAP